MSKIQNKIKSNDPPSIEAFCLTLPGRKLVLSDLLLGKKFRHRGGKIGAVKTFKSLETDGLGNLILVPGSRVSKHAIDCMYKYITHVHNNICINGYT